jgi:single-strand DNA-binding protein
MPQLIGLARLGKDAEVRYTPDGTAVSNLSLAFSYGKKGNDGKRPTQWVDASLWGDRAAALVEYLQKGITLYVVLDGVHIETYEGKNGQGHKLVGNVQTLEFAGSPSNGQQQNQTRPTSNGQQTARQQPQQRPSQPKTSTGFDDMDDDIPF